MADDAKKKKNQTPAEHLAEILGLNGMNGQIITGDEVEFHPGNRIGIPQGMTFESALSILERLREDSETNVLTSRTFKYRQNDGAHAAYHVIRKRYGMVLNASTWFKPAQALNIEVGVGKTMSVPWGLIDIPIFEGLQLNLQTTNHKEYGTIFEMYAYGPKKYTNELIALFDEVEVYLREHSIYRGQAIIGSDSPEFLDTTRFDESQIVFSAAATDSLEATVWGPMKYTESMRADGVNLKRAALLEGPFGTGKSSAGLITAKRAVENGWTFISAKPGRDNVTEVLRTAKLYQPAVVFVEDIDNETSSGDTDEVTEFLDAFDGITAKGGEIIAVLTTNHAERIHKGMLRAGRIDSLVSIAGLDPDGVERLSKAILKEKLDDNIDWVKVGDAMNDYLPAFVRESLERTKLFALTRTGGDRTYTVTTEDLVHAADSLKPQIAMLNAASEGELPPTLDAAVKASVAEAVKSLSVQATDHEEEVEWRIADTGADRLDS